MKAILQEKFNKKIIERFSYKLDIVEEGLYIVKIIARARSEKQIGLNERDDDDLRIEIDGRKFPKLDNPTRYFDSPAAFSGGKLHSLKKTIFFFAYLSKEKHTLTFIPDREPTLEELSIQFVGNKVSDIKLDINDQAEDGDRRPWITFVLVDLPLEQIQAEVKTQRRFLDSDDVKLIIDGKVKRNLRNIFRKLWFWIGSFFKDKTQTESFNVNLKNGLHYIEFWADRMPTLYKIRFDFGTLTKRIPSLYDPKWTGDFNDDSEQMILARAIFGEARNTSKKAKTAVAWSIKNRVADKRWGNTYHEVILEPKQYSAFNDSDPNYPFILDPFHQNNLIDKKSWKECYEIAGQVMSGKVADPTNEANHYYSDYIEPPYWTKSKQAQFKIKIDNILFYDIGTDSGSKGELKIFLSMALGAIGLIAVLLGVFIFQEWRSEKLWEEAIYGQETVEGEMKSQYPVESESEVENQHPAVTSNEDFYGEKTDFRFSPSKKYIAFVQNVFEEYGHDWDKYWALQLFYMESGTEKTLFVDDTRMSSYEWLSDETIRVFHNAGTGVRAYKNISVDREKPLFFKDYKRSESKPFWIVDEEYSQQVKDFEEARKRYYELSR